MNGEQTYRSRVTRVQREMAQRDLDAMILYKPQNTFYLSHFNALIYSRHVIAVVTRNDEPCLIVPRLRVDHAKSESRIRDIRAYHKIRLSDAPSTVASDPYELLRDVLQERGVADGTVGVERDYLTLNMWRDVQKILPSARFADVAPMFDQIRMVKDAEEIEMTRKAAAITNVGMRAALGKTRIGASEIEIAVAAMAAMQEFWMANCPDDEVAGFGGGEGWAFNELWCLCTSKRGTVALDSPTSRRLTAGDNPFIGVMATVNGYHAENERTPIVGGAAPHKVRAFEAHLEATRAMLPRIRPGASCAEVAQAAADIYEKRGYSGNVPARAGHSIGLSGHEGFSFALTDHTILQENMVVSVEPALSFEEYGWVGNSNTYLVTKTGCELLTDYRVNELIML
ncbi:MAG: Xaa-Pro peptidase family protein [Candidatus Bipolaricaulis sp.]|nr:Xaa-Pro peptidase family protein [Candidatus Bipolaricaulis sp.]